MLNIERSWEHETMCSWIITDKRGSKSKLTLEDRSYHSPGLVTINGIVQPKEISIREDIDKVLPTLNGEK